ncbi:MAG: hypothetical protein CMJ13_04945 [Pelagibacterales bacterium]|nr:hypothetical protein [Pelagibacterales bacterium]
MIESLSSIQNFNKVNPFSKVDTANGMPINNYRVVDPVSDSLRSKEFVSKENYKNLYTRTFSFSNGDTTEKFLKSKNLMTPVFIYNEAKTKYDMISKLEISLPKIKLNVDLFA